MFRLFGAVISSLIIASTTSHAATTDIPTFRGAQIIKSKPVEGSVIEVPLAKIYRSGRGWEPETVKRVEGRAFQTLYKIGRNVPLEEVTRYYENALNNINGSSTLFECVSRSCGSSNAWANNFFNDYLLYGADQSQFLKVILDGEGHYRILYINRRGAGDVMVRIDEVIPDGSGDAQVNILAQLSATDTPRIRSFLREQSDLTRIVAFITAASSDENPIERGDQYITAIKDAISADEARKLRMINLANMGNPVYGENRIIFISIAN